MEKSSFGWKDAFRNAAAFTPESAGRRLGLHCRDNSLRAK